MSLRALMQGPLPVTAPLVLNPLWGYRIVADPSTPLLAAYATWKKVYDDLADGFGARSKTKPDWGPVEKDMVAVIGLEKLLAVERATVEKGRGE